MKNKVKVEVQYFTGCPHSVEMIRRVTEALRGKEGNVTYHEILIETNELAERLKFRGSPTLLINGEDFEGLEEPSHISLSCRYYPNGLPSIDEIKRKITSNLQ